jgi:hypothetical protein
MKIEISRQSFEKYWDIKFNPVGSESFKADGRIDRHDKANSCFSNFVNAPKIVL